MTDAGAVLRCFDAMSFGTLDDIIGTGPPLILAPHPDDESLGCGGLIAACCARGTPPCVVVLTDGCGSHPSSRAYPPARLRAVREREVRDAVACLGGDGAGVICLGLPDTAAPREGPAFDAAVASLVALLEAGNHRVILAPWEHDPHGDHVASAVMARQAALASGARHLAYPVWGWTLPPQTPLPDMSVSGHRFDIAAHLPAKRRAIAAHASQYGELITDDPTGFRLPAELLAVFDRRFEVFLQC